MRADVFFKDKFGSRTKAAEAIEKGQVLVNGKAIKPKEDIKETDEIIFVLPKEQFVSNGGYKLSRAKEAFSLDFKGKTCVDIGASTGGFTDCLLQSGAKKVYAVDVGESQLHESLVHEKKIVVMDGVNARYLEKTDFLEQIDLVVTDVSFISLKLILPAISAVLDGKGEAVVLIKPQFECENKNIGKSGIVHPSAHAKIVEGVVKSANENGLYVFDIVNAPIRKGKNIEYVTLLKPQAKGALSVEAITRKIKELVASNSAGELV